jgi:hypothetical protein
MTSESEDAIKQALGIDSSRSLSIDKIFQLLAMWPDVDKDVAQVVLSQVPELASMSKVAMADIEATFRETLDASTQSAKALGEAVSNEMAMIGAALEKDPTNEALWSRNGELVALLAAKDTEVRQFSGRICELKVVEKIAVVALVAGALLVGIKSGGRASGGIGRVISAVRDAA